MSTHDHDNARRHPRGSSPNNTGDFIISGSQLGIGRTDNMSTLTVQARDSFTLTGTVVTTQDSATVTGTGTKFLTELNVGDTIQIPDTLDWFAKRIVSAIASDTSLTVGSPYRIPHSGAATAHPSAARFDDGAGNPKAIVTADGFIGVGTAAPKAMLDVTGLGADELDYCPVGIRVHSPLESDAWPLIMSFESNDGTTTSSSGMALWATQCPNDGGATLTFSLFHNNDITLHDHVKIDGNGLHLRSQFSANVGGSNSDYTVQPLDHILYGDPISTDITFTLPDSNDSVGRELYIYRLGGPHDLIVHAHTNDLINGVASKTLNTTWSGLHLICLYPYTWVATVLTPA
jgi:hypothetical protein